MHFPKTKAFLEDVAVVVTVEEQEIHNYSFVFLMISEGT
jgi:hypothetical protein